MIANSRLLFGSSTPVKPVTVSPLRTVKVVETVTLLRVIDSVRLPAWALAAIVRVRVALFALWLLATIDVTPGMGGITEAPGLAGSVDRLNPPAEVTVNGTTRPAVTWFGVTLIVGVAASSDVRRNATCRGAAGSTVRVLAPTTTLPSLTNGSPLRVLAPGS